MPLHTNRVENAPRSITLLFNFTEVMLWTEDIKLHSLHWAGYFSVLLPFLFLHSAQLHGMEVSDLISN